MDFTLDVDRHVHPDQPLVGQQVRALAAEAEGWIDLLQQREHVHVVDLAPGSRNTQLDQGLSFKVFIL